MITVKLDTTSNRNSVNRLRSGIEAATPQILDAVGRKLVGLARVYFDNLSRGGASFSGRKWASLKPSTVKKREALARRGLLPSGVSARGVVTGNMRASLEYNTSRNGGETPIYRLRGEILFGSPPFTSFPASDRLAGCGRP